MEDKTYVYLITGFLGAGKTTLLNNIIKTFPRDRKLSILMNEFGEVGIDGLLVEGTDIDMLEISRGSIFCVCVKTDFIKGLYELAQKLQPDILLIESTGVANPSDLKRDLSLAIFKGRYELKEQFCIIDASHFLDAYGAYTSLDKQIQSSTVFVINKLDKVDKQTIERIKEVIRQHHRSPVFYETTYCNIPLEQYFPTKEISEKIESPKFFLPDLSDEEFDKIVEDAISNLGLEVTPPDPLLSYTFEWKGNRLSEIEAFAAELPTTVPRAKGLLSVNDEVYLFSFVMGEWELGRYDMGTSRFIGPEEIGKRTGLVVIIAGPELGAKLQETAIKHNFKPLGAVMPYERKIKGLR